ncbi:DhNV_089 [Dikerogammarus haemobaphes nudivirus]|nr:DhNV_089 [Dikerogammarus haemobaphes nudivirus]
MEAYINYAPTYNSSRITNDKGTFLNFYMNVLTAPPKDLNLMKPPYIPFGNDLFRKKDLDTYKLEQRILIKDQEEEELFSKPFMTNKVNTGTSFEKAVQKPYISYEPSDKDNNISDARRMKVFQWEQPEDKKVMTDSELEAEEQEGKNYEMMRAAVNKIIEEVIVPYETALQNYKIYGVADTEELTNTQIFTNFIGGLTSIADQKNLDDADMKSMTGIPIKKYADAEAQVFADVYANYFMEGMLNRSVITPTRAKIILEKFPLPEETPTFDVNISGDPYRYIHYKNLINGALSKLLDHVRRISEDDDNTDYSDYEV